MLATLSFAFPALAKDAVLKSAKTMPELIKASSPADWRALNPENTLYLELEKGRVVIELAPDFAPQHAANIKTLIREGYFDGLAIVRSQENYVVQWADPDEKRELKTAKKSGAGIYSALFLTIAIHPFAGCGWLCAAGGACEWLCRRQRS
jgi:peptidylprolyl isomerase